MIETVSISSFKKVDASSLELGKINVLVGGNNSGKSCLLQGIHFGVTLSQSRAIAGSDQFPPEQLRYCPTDDFLNLHHRRRLTEGASVSFAYSRGTGETFSEARVSLTRDRNGVVKAQVSGGSLLTELSDPKTFFSIYVPGLAGISIREDYRSELVVNNGIARGDANLYLRNLLLRIGRNADRKARFSDHLRRVFPGCEVTTRFDESNDLSIRSEVKTPQNAALPLDMVGTGLLQAVQLIAYVTMYQPKLLLLDEPDAHLHPSNQRLLADALGVIVSNTDTKVILATHSRHLLDAFSENLDAKLFWVKDGQATPQSTWSDVAVLMDLGALDNGEKFLAGEYKYLIWTEDKDLKFLEVFTRSNGLDPKDTFIFSYQASSKVDSAKLMGAFVERIRPGVRTIIHRDRDFMSNDEIIRLTHKYNLASTPNVKMFITRWSDIESYFCRPEHISEKLGISISEAQTLIETAIQENQIEFVLKFQNKREEIKRQLYRSDPDSCPSAGELLPGAQVPMDAALGKVLLKRLGPRLQQASRNPSLLLAESNALADPEFKALFS